MEYLGILFGKLLLLCYDLIHNYGWAIVLFTLFTKIIMLPVSVMVQYNSIKMVRMYPEINRIKTKFFGSSDLISEERYKLYKKEKYNPMLDLIPVLVQLVLLMGVVEGVYRIVDTEPTMPFFFLNLADIPIKKLGITLLVPILAAISALLMCVTQNLANVLQSEQSVLNKTTTLVISVGLSLYLGLFVPSAVGLYWIASNLLSIALMYILNYFINPKKFIDYEELEKTRTELKELEGREHQGIRERSKDEIIREKHDYRRFDRFGSKQIVFYSEKNGFYKYFRDVIEYILNKTDIIIHYVTSDPEDEVFALENEFFRTYYIGENKLIVLMMKMDADIVVMTMPDLQKYHIKRSMVRQDTEYVYMDHGIGSMNMMLRKHALDYFDTIFATNEITHNEIRAMEQTYDLKEKKIVDYGFSLIDNMIRSYEDEQKSSENRKKNDIPIILIAPSWQKDNIMDLCVEEMLDVLKGENYQVIVRPHPQYVRHYEDRIQVLKEKYISNNNIEIQTDFSSNKTVYDADVLVTDWSGIAYEYSLTTLKPCLFINTPMKIMNPDYEEIGVQPLDLEIRSRIGIELEPDCINEVGSAIRKLLTEELYNPDNICKMREKYLYNVGRSAEVGAKYLIKRLIEYSDGK